MPVALHSQSRGLSPPREHSPRAFVVPPLPEAQEQGTRQPWWRGRSKGRPPRPNLVCPGVSPRSHSRYGIDPNADNCIVRRDKDIQMTVLVEVEACSVRIFLFASVGTPKLLAVVPSNVDWI